MGFEINPISVKEWWVEDDAGSSILKIEGETAGLHETAANMIDRSAKRGEHKFPF